MDFKILEFIRLHCKCKFMDFIMKNISTFLIIPLFGWF